MVEVFEIPVPFEFGIFRGHRPDHLRRGVVVETVRAVPGVIEIVGAIDASDDVAAELGTLLETLLADVGDGIEVELGQHRCGSRLLDVTVFGCPERRLLREGRDRLLEQGLDMLEGLAGRTAAPEVVVDRIVDGHASEVVEPAHVEVGRDGVQLVDVVGLDLVVEPDGVVVYGLEVGFGLQGARDAPVVPS